MACLAGASHCPHHEMRLVPLAEGGGGQGLPLAQLSRHQTIFRLSCGGIEDSYINILYIYFFYCTREI